MKQIAVRSLVWGISTLALFQLPALARPQALSQPSKLRPSEQYVWAQGAKQLPAVALTKRDLRLGDRGADVRALQRYLSRNGLYPFVIDGTFGQETANSVATYQRIRELPATGIADESTLVDMGFEFVPGVSAPVAVAPQVSRSGSIGAGTLGPGSRGSDVIALQQRLNGFGIPVFVDGVYGFETQQAVRTYQRVQGLTVSGTADSETLETMGFAVTRLPYVAAVIAKESELAEVQRFFPDAYVDRNRRGRFINIGTFAERFPAEARVDAAAARGFATRVLYR
ncbi:MAG: peptidoglycan-binding protein [Phormidesmis sp.]